MSFTATRAATRLRAWLLTEGLLYQLPGEERIRRLRALDVERVVLVAA